MQPKDVSCAGKGSSLPQLDGILVLNKPSGPTSARCVSVIKRLGQKKIGHAGTLDPLASGVLLILLGQATKLSGYLMADGGKVYSGTLRLGQTTDTWDSEGVVTTEAAWEYVREQDLRQEIAAWCDLTEQPVPFYSAAKFKGKPLYKLARKGIAAPVKVKRIQILQAEVLDVSLPFVRFRVTCSSGTYIRSLAHSLGKRLGCGAVLTELTREFSHPFGLEMSCDLAEIVTDPDILPTYVHPIAEALPRWHKVELSSEDVARVRNGVAVPCQKEALIADDQEDMDCALLLDQGTALALAQRQSTPRGHCWAVLRGLWN